VNHFLVLVWKATAFIATVDTVLLVACCRNATTILAADIRDRSRFVQGRKQDQYFGLNSTIAEECWRCRWPRSTNLATESTRTEDYSRGATETEKAIASGAFIEITTARIEAIVDTFTAE
jgi:hypothetical protein